MDYSHQGSVAARILSDTVAKAPGWSPGVFSTHMFQQQGTTVVQLTGSVDIGAAPRFSAVMDDVITTEPEAILLDLRGVQLLDTEGFAVLIGVRNEPLRAGKTRLVVGERRADVSKLFRAMKLVDSFDFAPPIP